MRQIYGIVVLFVVVGVLGPAAPGVAQDRLPSHAVGQVPTAPLADGVMAAARAGLALIWKIVLVVEFLGRSSGVGFQIHMDFQLFDVGMVLVYALSFIAVMLAVEWLILQPLERRVRHWRSA